MTLKESASGRMVFRMSLTAWMVVIFLPMIGGGVGILLLIVSLLSEASLIPFGGVLAVTFTGVGVYLLRRWSVPRVFDRNRDWYWRSRKTPDFVHGVLPEESCRVSDIHAIQLLEEEYGSTDDLRWSYEINLVLKSGKRLNVVDHRRERVIRRNAALMSRFLGVPVVGCHSPLGGESEGLFDVKRPGILSGFSLIIRFPLKFSQTLCIRYGRRLS